MDKAVIIEKIRDMEIGDFDDIRLHEFRAQATDLGPMVFQEYLWDRI